MVRNETTPYKYYASRNVLVGGRLLELSNQERTLIAYVLIGPHIADTAVS